MSLPPKHPQEAVQMPHGAVAPVVQDHEGPFARAAIGERTIHPAIWIAKIARNGVPEHAGVFARRQPLDHRRMQQATPEFPCASAGPEEANRLIEPRESLFGPLEFPERGG